MPLTNEEKGGAFPCVDCWDHLSDHGSGLIPEFSMPDAAVLAVDLEAWYPPICRSCGGLGIQYYSVASALRIQQLNRILSALQPSTIFPPNPTPIRLRLLRAFRHRVENLASECGLMKGCGAHKILTDQDPASVFRIDRFITLAEEQAAKELADLKKNLNGAHADGSYRAWLEAGIATYEYVMTAKRVSMVKAYSFVHDLLRDYPTEDGVIAACSGFLLAWKRDLPASLQMLSRLADAEPKCAAVLLEAARTLDKAGKYDECMHLMRAARVAPDFDDLPAKDRATIRGALAELDAMKDAERVMAQAEADARAEIDASAAQLLADTEAKAQAEAGAMQLLLDSEALSEIPGEIDPSSITHKALVAVLQDPQLHRAVVGDYDEPYTFGIVKIQAPNTFRWAILVRVSGTPPATIPYAVNLSGYTVPIVIEGGFKAPVAL